MADYAELLADVIRIVRRIDPQKRTIGPDTRILTDLDLDSLAMLDLIETINTKYGMDVFQEPYSLNNLRTPSTIADSLINAPTVFGQANNR